MPGMKMGQGPSGKSLVNQCCCRVSHPPDPRREFVFHRRMRWMWGRLRNGVWRLWLWRVRWLCKWLQWGHARVWWGHACLRRRRLWRQHAPQLHRVGLT